MKKPILKHEIHEFQKNQELRFLINNSDGECIAICNAHVAKLVEIAPEMLILLNLIDNTFLSDCISTKADVDLGYVRTLRNKVADLFSKVEDEVLCLK